MKKTLRTILAGAVALLAVSCYDDSEVMKGLKDLDERLTAVETTLNAEVGGIQDIVSRLSAVEGALNAEQTGILARLDAIDDAADGKIKDLEAAIDALEAADKAFDAELAETLAKIAITKVEQVNGSWVLTPASGDPITLSKSGLVTITKVDDKDYWATVGEDGQAVSTGVPVAHPDYTFSFTVENGELKYAVNGGDAVGTGVTTGDLTGQDYLIGDVEVAEDGKSVTIIIGEAEYVLPMYEPAPMVMIKSGKQFFDYAEAKEIEVKIEGVSDLVVMNQPYGWKAKVKGSILTVTAPSETNVDAEKDGKIVLHGSANGQCVTAVLNVMVGTGLSMTLTADGKIEISNALIALMGNAYHGYQEAFADAMIGIMTVEEFESYSSVGEMLLAATKDYSGEHFNTTYLQSVKDYLSVGGDYVKGSYEIDKYTFAVEDMASKVMWPKYDIVKGEKYVVYALPMAPEYLFDDYLYVYYEPIYVEYAETKSAFDIELELDLYGVDKVMAGAVSVSELQNADVPQTFDEYMMDKLGGPWANFQSYNEFEALGEECVNGAKVSVAKLMYEDLVPGAEYYVWLMPIKEGKAISEYSYEKDLKPYMRVLKTKPLEKGDVESEVTLNEENTTYSTIAVDITPAAGSKVYYGFFKPEAVNEMNEEQKVAAAMADCNWPSEEAEMVRENDLSDGTVMTFIAVTVVEGKYTITELPVQTLAYPRSEEITVSFVSCVAVESGYTATINVTGATKLCLAAVAGTTEDVYLPEEIFKNGASGNISEDYYCVDVVDGVATVNFNANTFYGHSHIQFIAYNIVGDSVVMSEYGTGAIPASSSDDDMGGGFPMLP